MTQDVFSAIVILIILVATMIPAVLSDDSRKENKDA